jgi:thymidylate kinase
MSIKIVISGTTGSGKTTVALEVMQALKRAGFKPVLKDQDGDPTPLYASTQSARVRALASDGLKIEVSTVQTPRRFRPRVIEGGGE